MDRCYRVWADIDLDAIRKNIKTMRSYIPHKSKLMAVIKANAYGHGAVEVAKALDDLAQYFGVACIDEAVELRKAGIDKPILILGATHESWYEEVVGYNVAQTVFTLKQAKALSETAGKLGRTAVIHIKLDTGMNRIGFACGEESIPDILAVSKLPNLKVEGIFTHYFMADAADKSSAERQLAEYTRMVELLEEQGMDFSIRHISNSAGIMEMPNDCFDMVRSGISTYGLYPSEEMDKAACVLYPAMELKSRITYVKTVKAGESVSYGGTYVMPTDKRIATVGVGYADGYPRALSNRGRMLVHGKYAPVVGRVCMDQTMIDVSEISDVQPGDEVVLFGRQGVNTLSVEELAEMSSSFNYEFVCDVNRRVPRVFHRDGNIIAVKNYLNL
ncbi:MAG: alanine racemase [Lachnospiraceae bacterium]|nr:alanine racemase [Lachnospiraceae bacterium]